ncbi:MAG: PD-(D/E)XK nuclease family protein [Alistipes sp.]|nr:PD-(D/E)XK nuclease family protein [Alistipes sp.]
MRTFLEEAAGQLYERYGNDCSSLVVVFPSRRARIFFSNALADIANRPMWEPAYMTIDEIMMHLADLRSADRIRLVAELYRIYSKYHNETFDKFYHWGEMLISDFDMVDKYCVDASRLFRNISDLKELEADLDYLSPRQMEIVREFWGTLDDSTPLSEQKRRFLEIWRTLGTIYDEYREHLRSLGIGYTGMIHRTAIERLAKGEHEPLESRRYVFLGFNALSSCEMQLLKYMQNNHDTSFFWDYDDYYTNSTEQEAGMFIRRNKAELKAEEGTTHDNLRKPKEINVITTGTSVGQCKYAVSRLLEIAGKDKRGEINHLDKDTAVVLTDENMLMPLLYALPKELGRVNVTMGYPLRNTLAYSFVERLLELQNHSRIREGEPTFYHVDVEGILSHPYIADTAPKQIARIRKRIVDERIYNVERTELCATELLAQIFSPAKDSEQLLTYLRQCVEQVTQYKYKGDDASYRGEYLAQTLEGLTKLHNIINSCDMEMSVAVCRSLVRRHLQSIRIPFRGEPLQGLQVMGILETRNLDFRNVIILSMTDNNFPGSHTSDSSFIPYNLRFAYGLPTPEHHEGVYAYYFYRLIQRAERVDMIYCSRADEKGTGEPSRYIRQLEYETSFPINYTNVSVDVTPFLTSYIEIEKSEEVMRSLERFVTDGGSTLSPTAFSRYVQCPLKFYFASVARLRPEDALTEDVDNQTFGNIFHKAAEYLYTQIKGVAKPAALLQRMVEDGTVEQMVDRAIASEYFKQEDTKRTPQLEGEIEIIRNIVLCFLRDNVAQYDIRRNDFAINGLEWKVNLEYPFHSAGRDLTMHFEGYADRIESLDNGTLRIIDYKTGTEHLSFASLESLFFGEARERQSNFINTMLYAMMLHRKIGLETQPTLYYIRKMGSEEYSPLITDKSRKSSGDLYSTYAEEFEGYISQILAEMYDPVVPFTQCEDRKQCEMCDFAQICARK